MRLCDAAQLKGYGTAPYGGQLAGSGYRISKGI